MVESGSADEIDALSLIRQLNDTDEHSRCEAKTSQEFGRSLMETICAFSNEPGLGGGRILLGVAKTTNTFWPAFEFVGIDDPDALQGQIASRCQGDFNRSIRPIITTDTIHGRVAMVVTVLEAQPSEKPIYFVKEGLPRGAYRRIGSSDQRCSQDDLLLFYGSQQVDTFDKQIVSDSTLDDIDPRALGTFRALKEGIRSDAPELLWSDSELLRALGCAKPTESGLKPTVAGVLLFGKQIAIRRCFPMMRVDYVRIPGTEWVENPDERFETIEIRGPLIKTVQRAHSAILDDLPRAFSLPSGSLQREDIPLLPDRVVREVVVNAVMHRCYRTNGPIGVMRYSNRIEIRNPGHSLISPDRLGQPGSETRNPTIAAVLYDIGFAETKGSGIDAMRKLMKAAMLPPPVFESDREGNRFVVYLLLHHFLGPGDVEWLAHFSTFGLTEEEQIALFLAREMKAIDNATYREISGTDTLGASRHLRRLMEFGLLDMRGKGSQTYYKPTDMLLNPQKWGDKLQSGESVVKSGGLGSKSGGLGDAEAADSDSLPEELSERIARLGGKTSRKRMERLILELCAWRPLMPAEIARFLKRKSVKRLVESYISPMVDRNQLVRMIPSTPTHPAQRYKTSPQGIQDLLFDE